MVNFLLALLHTFSLWKSNFKLLSIFIPRSLTYNLTTIFRHSLSAQKLSCLLPEIMRWHLSVFNFIWLLSNQHTANAESCSKRIKILSRLISQAWGEVSAKLQTVSFKTKNRSFRKILNKIGPRTEPCGTPLSNVDQELKVVWIFVLCQQF